MPAQRFSPMVPNQQQFLHGADYNPDQWLKYPDIIDEDFRLMPLAGFTSVSIGIFSWSAIEPAPGQYQFEWMDDIINRCAEQGISVILATPTASMPAWLADAHPEARRVFGPDGRRDQYRERHNHCPTSPIYREHSARINRELAKRYGSHPAVVLWHLSNELGGTNGDCRCDVCQSAFRDWLKQRYGSLDHVNDAWWNAFWGHNLNDWQQIHTNDIIHDGMALDWRRFVTQTTLDYMLVEKAAVREFSDLPVTTNFMGRFQPLDYWRFAEHIDVISNDCYPAYSGRGDETTHANTASVDSDLMRSMAGGKPWLLMESTPSNLNWAAEYTLKRPGVHQREMRQHIGLGADGTCYFQWRKSRGGSEKHHGAVVDHEGSERTRVFQDIATHGAALKNMSDILGTGVDASVAVVQDWESRWALETSHGPRKADPTKGYQHTVNAHCLALRGRGCNIDLPESRSDFSAYKLLVLPMTYLMDTACAERIESFVANGGIVMATYLSAIVDPMNRCHLGGWPGAGLRSVFGIWNEELDGLPDDARVQIDADGTLAGFSGTFQAQTFCERVHCEGAETIATYGSEFYAGSPAVTMHRYGKGYAYYCAARLEQKAIDALCDGIVAKHDIPTISDQRLPQGVQFATRSDGSTTYLFVYNWLAEQTSVSLPTGTWTNMESDETAGSAITLPPAASLVFRSTV